MMLSYNGNITGIKEQLGLDLSNLTPGVYFVSITNGIYRKTHKVVKQ